MMNLMVGLLTCLKGRIISFCLSILILSRLEKQKSLRQIYNNLFRYNQGLQDATEKLILQHKQSHQFVLLRTDVDFAHTQKREFAWRKNVDDGFLHRLSWSANQFNLKLFKSFNQGQIQVSEFSPRLGGLWTGYNKRKAGFGLSYTNLEWLLNRDRGFALSAGLCLTMRALPYSPQSGFSKGNNCNQLWLDENDSYWRNIRWQFSSDSAGQVVDVGNASEMVVSWRGSNFYRDICKNIAIQKKYSDFLPEISLNTREPYLDALVMLKECLVSFDGSNNSYQQILQILGQAIDATRVCIYDYSSYGCTFREKHCTGLIASPKAEWQKKGVSQPDQEVWKNLCSQVFCSHWEQILSRGESISGIVSHLSGAVLDRNIGVTKLATSEHHCQILESQNKTIILILPIVAKKEFLGFIGFENHLETHTWDKSEIAFLQAAVGAISLAYQSCRVEDALQTVIVETGNAKSELENQMHNSTLKLQQEIASRNLVQIELEKSRSLQQATLESTADGILVIDNCGNITGYNQKFVQMWGIPESTIKSGSNQSVRIALSQLKYPKQYIASIRELHRHPEAQINDAIALKDGRIFERFSQPQTIGGNIVGRVWSFRDITAHKQAEAKIKHQALHDLLTDLPNRVLFNERLADALVQVSDNNEQLAVCFLDLDRFKTINDTLGHAIGDQLLQSVSARLTQSLREGDIIARWGGDEFTILLPKIRDVKDAANIQERILAALKPVFDIENHHLHISASIGVALYPVHGEDAETLIKHADVALYGAKSQGRNKYQFYNSAINSQATELLVLENSLYHALERHEFTVHYQPQVNITTSEITKMEALLRWQHPELGLISPAKFIPLAEDTGLIVPIGEWVLRTACSQTKHWQNQLALPSLSIAVNLSARQFQQPNLVELIKQILTETQLAPECLELEITESVAMQNIELTIDILNQLNRMGVSISIDDFGTGYCSLSYLKNFPIHTLKIDRSFVRDLTTNTQDAAITTAIIALAHGLNLAVVAEGVETEEQRDVLKILKCELMQGYLFSCAVSAEDATRLLQKCRFSIIDDSCLIA